MRKIETPLGPQTFTDGLAVFYRVKNEAGKGDRPKYTMEEFLRVPFTEKKVGDVRYYAAMQADIQRAAQAARAHDFISALPQGYDTVVGDQGVKLSGGQRQRLALARALLHDPAILILDEATAMFDPEGEAEFVAECHQVLRERTVIMITHRPASLALADRVLRLEAGRLQV